MNRLRKYLAEKLIGSDYVVMPVEPPDSLFSMSRMYDDGSGVMEMTPYFRKHAGLIYKKDLVDFYKEVYEISIEVSNV